MEKFCSDQVLDLAKLSEFTCHFLERKCDQGLEKLLGEALLVIGVGKHLAECGWNIDVERELAKVYNVKADKGLGYMSYDLDAELSGEKIVFEMKFLKPKSKRVDHQQSTSAVHPDRISDDLIKLSYVDYGNIRRFFVLGRSSQVKADEGPNKFLEGKREVFLKFGEPSSELDRCYKTVKPSKWFADRIKNEFGNSFPKPVRLSRKSQFGHGRIEVEVFEISTPN